MAIQKTVLYIEDDPQLVEEVTVACRRMGIKVRAAYDGRQALALLGEKPPDLILLDLVLPKGNGFAVLEEVRRNPQTATIPVIVLSNLGNPSSVDRALALGVVKYLIKTDNTLQEVVAHVKNVLGTS